MSEIGGITELQLLEAEVALLENKLEVAKNAESTSVSCSRIAGSISAAQAKDGFLVTEGGVPNQFHTSAGTAGKKSCCVIS